MRNAGRLNAHISTRFFSSSRDSPIFPICAEKTRQAAPPTAAISRCVAHSPEAHGNGSAFARARTRRPAERRRSVAMENTIGDVPIQWFRDEEHIGYDADGRKILKRARVDHLDHLLQMVDDPTYWRKVFDEREDKEISISREQVRAARRRSFAHPPLRVLVPSRRR